MSITKQTVIESAIHYFSTKGYQATSIQDIADDCGIGKGSLYKFFSSKEELFIGILEYLHHQMFQNVERITGDPSLSKREKFEREIAYQIEFFISHKVIMSEIHSMAIHDKQKYADRFSELRSNTSQYYKDSLLRAYGPETEPFIWDLVAIYFGIIKEYVFLIIFNNQPLAIDELAAFVADRLDDIAAGMLSRGARPLLGESAFHVSGQPGSQYQEQAMLRRRTELLEALESLIQKLPVRISRRDELLEAAAGLRTELEGGQPKPVMVHALLLYLETEHALAGIVKQLANVIHLR
ncbi:TetR/AcrR family transcriptional regulator [Paenibacillus beijingensis]|uniref:HTH tetR-type domain-containing protein n=1 Tax=Paenibacillus beijingensis TaxID=1126833 RepID=A0A0D5NE30_9BACL|nr:TetR/AcrR family transcriptional regulator [Paenibacillus beijingensis]AJY73420.1 hypothetical protein VN24_00720 [Paenibacillus beijingensis]